jgi:hypothetical protein
MLSGLLFAGTYLVIHHQLEPKFLVLLFPLMALVFMVKLYRKDEKPFLHIAYTFLGLLYVAIAAAYFLMVRIMHKMVTGFKNAVYEALLQVTLRSIIPDSVCSLLEFAFTFDKDISQGTKFPDFKGIIRISFSFTGTLT